MIIIIDTNILTSAALNKESDLFKIITNNYELVEFVTPSFTLEEIAIHKNRICFKAEVDVLDFENNLDFLLIKILLIPDAEVSNSQIIEAELLTKSIDFKDTIFVAFSIALNSMLWTGDTKLYKGLKRKGFTNIINTKELKLILKGLWF